MTFPLAIIEFRFGVAETLIWTNLGGILGIYFFAYLSQMILDFWHAHIAGKWFSKKRRDPEYRKLRKKAVFTRRNRRIVAIKSKYGLPGIALATPILLSIPVGVFIVVRYFNRKKYKFIYLVAGNFIWSLIYTGFYGFSFHLFQRITAAL